MLPLRTAQVWGSKTKPPAPRIVLSTRGDAGKASEETGGEGKATSLLMQGGSEG